MQEARSQREERFTMENMENMEGEDQVATTPDQRRITPPDQFRPSLPPPIYAGVVKESLTAPQPVIPDGGLSPALQEFELEK
jgi:hypothetical protein